MRELSGKYNALKELTSLYKVITSLYFKKKSSNIDKFNSGNQLVLLSLIACVYIDYCKI
jgi:hypothetical protein